MCRGERTEQNQCTRERNALMDHDFRYLRDRANQIKGQEAGNASRAAQARSSGLALLPFRRRLRLRARDVGHKDVEGILRAHFLLAALVVPVFMLVAASTAARFQHLFARHGDNGMVSGEFAAGAVVIDIVTQARHGSIMRHRRAGLQFAL